MQASGSASEITEYDDALDVPKIDAPSNDILFGSTNATLCKELPETMQAEF